MAFDFLGTFTEQEIRDLLDFADKQLPDVKGRLANIRGKVEKIGWIDYDKDDSGNRTSFFIEPSNSLLEKYILMYQFYGGDVLGLQIKSRGQWLYYTKGEAVLDDNVEYQGGKVEGAEYDTNIQADDSLEAIATAKVKDWCSDAIQGKREEWEFRIKKAIDVVDQYLEEIILLIKRSEGVETIDDLKIRLEYYLTHPEFSGAGKKRENLG